MTSTNIPIKLDRIGHEELLPYRGPIPRAGEHLFYDGARYWVTQVQYHCASASPQFTPFVKVTEIVVILGNVHD